MCGIAAILNLNAPSERDDRKIVKRMRDRLTHRGPDDSGLHQSPWGCIGHRRLSVIDTSAGGHQPMTSRDGRFVLAYNGELYNDHDLRAELGSMGVEFCSRCDTETLLHALIEWGPEAIGRIRGMYAFVFLDTKEGRAILARDPMGIKPLYHASFMHEDTLQLAIGSELPALLEHPAVTPEPDPVTLSAYLTTLRATLGTRTMFRGIHTLEPGDSLMIDLSDPSNAIQSNWWDTCSDRPPAQGLTQTIEDSVHRHLRTDVPMCALLSGGLDSAITTLIARQSTEQLHTYCAGARSEGFDDDFAFAAMMAEQLGTEHHEVEVTQEIFTARLPQLIERMGNPMSTPNTIAIHEVATALRHQGHIVTISGEGADELFAGYAPIMTQCAARISDLTNPSHDPDGGLFQLRANAWISEELKPGVLSPALLLGSEHDMYLREHYTSVFDRLQSPGVAPLEAHLRFQQHLNLPNLLERLDIATMLAGVEGRTPFADIEVALCARAIPMDQKFIDAPDTNQEARTKITLREAFADRLPARVINRPKASFPLPFQHWMGSHTRFMASSPIASELFSDSAIKLVASEPTKYWHMAWPMVNLTLWGHAWLLGDPAEQDQYAETATC